MAKRINFNFVSKILVLVILVRTCFDTVNGSPNKLKKLFERRENKFMEQCRQAQYVPASSPRDNQFAIMMEQCRQAQYVPARSPLFDEADRIHPEFLNYLVFRVRDMPGGVESEEFKILCDNAKRAGFGPVVPCLKQELQPSGWAALGEIEPNTFLRCMKKFRQFPYQLNPSAPIHDKNGKTNQIFLIFLKRYAKYLLDMGVDLELLYKDGKKAGYESDVLWLRQEMQKQRAHARKGELLPQRSVLVTSVEEDQAAIFRNGGVLPQLKRGVAKSSVKSVACGSDIASSSGASSGNETKKQVIARTAEVEACQSGILRDQHALERAQGLNLERQELGIESAKEKLVYLLTLRDRGQISEEQFLNLALSQLVK